MNDNSSIGEFFYNIIPGALFLFSLNYFYHINIVEILGFKTSDSAISIFIYITIGLFLGFLFQGITKIVRQKLWNERVFNKIKNDKRYKEEFNKVCVDILGPDYEEKDCNDIIKIIYLMDNYLRGINRAFLPTHFSSRFAFWANISWGALFLIIINLFSHLNTGLNFWLLLFLLFSFWMADLHLYNYHDSIVKCYYMQKVKK